MSTMISHDDGESPPTHSVTSHLKKHENKSLSDHAGFESDSRSDSFVLSVCLMEFVYYFVSFSLDMFLLHGLTYFAVSEGPAYIYTLVFRAKACGAAMSILFGAVIDSYIRNLRFFVLLILLALLPICPLIYFVISFPVYWLSTPAKLYIFQYAAAFHGLFCLMEPVRVCTIATAAIEVLGYTKNRTFFARLVLCQKIGIATAALGIYLCRSSRTKYATLMLINLVFIAMYMIFWLFCVKTLLISRQTPVGVVERTLLNLVFYSSKKIDQICLRRRIFGHSSSRTEYRFVHFRERTAWNAWTTIGIVAVLIPLTGYFTITEGVDHFCSLQSSNLIFKTEQFPLIGTKACFFIATFPFFEWLIVPQLRKTFKSVRTEQLALIGIGALIVTGAVLWASVIQHMILREKDYVTYPGQPSGHVVLMNSISSKTKVRGEHLNKLLGLPRNAWYDLEPYVPFKVLHVPLALIPFQLSLYNSEYGIYDDFNLTFVEDYFNWFIVCPEKFVQLPVGTFHRVPEIAADPKYLSKAIVNVICRLPLCQGYLEFWKKSRNSIRVYYPTPEPVTTLELAGEFVITFAMVGNTTGVRKFTFTFHRLAIYIVTILPPAEHAALKKTDSGGRAAAAVSEYAFIRIVPTSSPPDIPYAWIYPEAILHALSELFSKASLYAWLYDASPPELRSTFFCLTTFLSMPWYILVFHTENPLDLQQVKPLGLFSLACVHGFLLIIYCCSCVFYCRRTFEETGDEPKKLEVKIDGKSPVTSEGTSKKKRV